MLVLDPNGSKLRVPKFPATAPTLVKSWCWGPKARATLNGRQWTPKSKQRIVSYRVYTGYIFSMQSTEAASTLSHRFLKYWCLPHQPSPIPLVAHPINRYPHIAVLGKIIVVHMWRHESLILRCGPAQGVPEGVSTSSSSHESDWLKGKIYKKIWSFPWKMNGSCRFSLEPILRMVAVDFPIQRRYDK